MEQEIWVDIEGFPKGTYQVSNMGRIRNMKFGYERILKTPADSNGYCVIGLTNQGKQKSYKVHRIVWEAFNGPIPEGLQINHIDENKENNRLDNLNLMTSKENNNWGTRTKRMAEKVSVPVICTKEFASMQEAARFFGLTTSAICTCCQGKQVSAGGFQWKYKNNN